MNLSDKQQAELKFWQEERDRYAWWYHGLPKSGEMYGIPCPIESQKIKRHKDVRDNALETWVNADKWRYCKHLFIEPTYWSGHEVLEIGCGPLGLSRFFAGAYVKGVDPLLSEYWDIGYKATIGGGLVECDAEALPCVGGQFDAAFSVNAIDHVEDFEAACAELERVVADDGEIRIEVHYHAPTVTEPHSLSDERVKAAFKKFDMRKIAENPSHRFYPRGTHPESDRFALWSNRDYLYPAVDVLK